MNKLLLIDANSLIHRCFHALPPLTGPNNQPSGALYGLANILLKILREQIPDYVTAFFDRPEPTFRKEIFDEYKIHRPKAPDHLISQIIEAHQLFISFGIKVYEAQGFEADDLIGTAVNKFKETPNLKIVILTGDLDSLQLVKNDKVVSETFKKGVSETIIYNEDAVRMRYDGLTPEQIADFKGLVGDPSDNIPGVPGIGPKTAIPLIKEYKSLEGFLANGQLDKNFVKIENFKDQALLSKRLAIIRCDAPLDIKKISDLEYRDLPKETLISYFKKLGFKTLTQRV